MTGGQVTESTAQSAAQSAGQSAAQSAGQSGVDGTARILVRHPGPKGEQEWVPRTSLRPAPPPWPRDAYWSTAKSHWSSRLAVGEKCDLYFLNGWWEVVLQSRGSVRHPLCSTRATG